MDCKSVFQLTSPGGSSEAPLARSSRSTAGRRYAVGLPTNFHTFFRQGIDIDQNFCYNINRKLSRYKIVRTEH